MFESLRKVIPTYAALYTDATLYLTKWWICKILLYQPQLGSYTNTVVLRWAQVLDHLLCKSRHKNQNSHNFHGCKDFLYLLYLIIITLGRYIVTISEVGFKSKPDVFATSLLDVVLYIMEGR